MNILKKENGQTLIELIIALGIMGMMLVIIGTAYLSINKTYVRSYKKALNLEEARIGINHITDIFQTYGGCEVIIDDGSPGGIELQENTLTALDGEGFGVVKELRFKNPSVSTYMTKITYKNDTLSCLKNGANNNLVNEVSNFKAKRREDLLDLKIELTKEGHGVVADQTIELGTTLSLKYMP